MAVDATVQVVMPEMGESISEGVILEWHRQVGEAIAADETIVEISTDKVDAEVPAPASGTITEILAEAGETVSVGQVLARMTADPQSAPADGSGAPAPAATATDESAAAPAAAAPTDGPAPDQASAPAPPAA